MFEYYWIEKIKNVKLSSEIMIYHPYSFYVSYTSAGGSC